uniref:HMA domain-containing protein n=1 Tax=Picea sitchensis TaxID=3332 RepID=A9P2F5_PICSI|nr:unknown [Picea sitchensis]
MTNKTVMSLDLRCDKCKKIALHSITKIEGIDSLSIDMKERTLTVIGDADPVGVANMLRTKFRCAKLLSAGPVPSAPAKKKEEEKKEEQKDEKKGEKKEEKKGEKKEEKKENPDGKKTLMAPQPMWYSVCEAQCYPPSPDCSDRPEILWPRYQNPHAPNEVTYVWNEEKQDPCTTM